MKVTVNFGSVGVIVPCGNGDLYVRDVIELAVTRYKKATGKPHDAWITVHNLKTCNDGGILDPDDVLSDVCDDKEQIMALFEEQTSPCPPHNGGDGTSASSVGTDSPTDLYRHNDINHNRHGSGKNIGEKIPLDVVSTTLQVRRGSEPALNRLLSDSDAANDLDASKRWSAAVMPDEENNNNNFTDRHNNNKKRTDSSVPCTSSSSSSDESELPLSPVGERGEGEGGLRELSRSSGRLSMLGVAMYRWADAADRQLFKSQDSRKEPLGGSGFSPEHETDRGSEISATDDVTSPLNNNNNNSSTTTIVLKNEAGPLGIHVVPDSCLDGDRGLVIQGIEPEGRVDRDGRLRVGDRIVTVNGRSLINVNFQRAQEMFKETLKDPEIIIELAARNSSPHKSPLNTSLSRSMPNNVGRENEATENGPRIATVAPTPAPPPIAAPRQPPLASVNTRKVGKRVRIDLVKGKDGLGFSVTTRDNPAGGNCPIYIKNILPTGSAIQDGRLRSGDRLLEVNGIEMTGKTQAEAVAILRAIDAGAKVELIVARQSDDLNLPRVLPTPEEDSFQVGIFPWKEKQILRFNIPLNDTGSAGLGISVKGKTTRDNDETHDVGIFIKSVIHGGAASKDGRLMPNDQLLDVNGLNLLGMTNSQAMDTLRKAMIGGPDGPVRGFINLMVARRVPSKDSDDETKYDEAGFLSGSAGGDSLHLRSDSSDSSTHKSPVGSDIAYSPIEKKSPQLDAIADQSGNDNTVIYVPRSAATSSTPSGSSSGLYGQAGSRNPVIDRLLGETPMRSATPSDLLKAAASRDESYSPTQLQSLIYGRSNVRPTPNTYSPNSPSSGGKQVSPSRGDDVVINDDYAGGGKGGGARERKGSIDDVIDGKGRNEREGGGLESVPSTPRLDANGNHDLSSSDLSIVAEPFARDGFGRQSISEKRHAQLDAKSTDTYKRTKQQRDTRERDGHSKSPTRRRHHTLTAGIDPKTMHSAALSQNLDPRSASLKRHHHHHPQYVHHYQRSFSGGFALYGSVADSMRHGAPSGGLPRSNSVDSLVGPPHSHRQPRVVGPPSKPTSAHPASPPSRRNGKQYSPGCPYHTAMATGDSPGTESSTLSETGKRRLGASLESIDQATSGSGGATCTRPKNIPSGVLSAKNHGRTRPTNDSFRFAVDRSYPAPGDDSEGPRTPLRNAIPLEAILLEERKCGDDKPRKKGIFRGLGTVFRFGKNRKTVPEPGARARAELEREAEKLRSRRDEQLRLQHQYRKYMEQPQQAGSVPPAQGSVIYPAATSTLDQRGRPRWQNHQQTPPHHNITNYDADIYGSSRKAMSPPTYIHHQSPSHLSPSMMGLGPRREFSPPGGEPGRPLPPVPPIISQYGTYHATYSRRNLPKVCHPADRESSFSRSISLRSTRTLQRQDGSDLIRARAATQYDVLKETLERPGSRVGVVDPNQHYVNFNEIQQHIRNGAFSPPKMGVSPRNNAASPNSQSSMRGGPNSNMAPGMPMAAPRGRNQSPASHVMVGGNQSLNDSQRRPRPPSAPANAMGRVAPAYYEYDEAYKSPPPMMSSPRSPNASHSSYTQGGNSSNPPRYVRSNTTILPPRHHPPSASLLQQPSSKV